MYTPQLTKPFIRITRKPYEEPYHLNLLIEASNGSQCTRLEFYDNADCLSKLANALEGFPRHLTEVFLWELGSERPEDRFGFYFRFRAFVIDSAGHCAIQLRLSNNEELPDLERAEFCMRAEPEQFTRLGKLFREFSRLKHEVLEWEGDDGRLFVSRNDV
jgi:hypothetical protein